jgi:hypothetical protein
MSRRRNAAFPPQLRNIETALDWAIKEGGLKYEDDFPEGIESYAELQDFMEKHEDNLQELERDDYDTFEDYFNAYKIIENAEDYLDIMTNFEQSPRIELYRSIMVPSLEAIRFKDVGIYWAFDADNAEPHWGDYSTGNFEVTLTGSVATKHIDWEGSFLSYTTMGEDESEVRLDAGAPIQIMAIDGVAPDAPLWGTA